jgi:enamine deaminase RidA (YjgF/YER057c/UK114 family)
MTANTPAARATGHQSLLPQGWPVPKGYANGVIAEGPTIYVGGQIGWDLNGAFAEDFAGQFRQTLENIVAVLAAGGGRPSDLVRMTWFVTDIEAYRANLAKVGQIYRAVIGRHYPAMSVVQVVGLVEAEALIEIEATAVLAR